MCPESGVTHVSGNTPHERGSRRFGRIERGRAKTAVRLLPLSLVVGAAFLVACDAVARSIVPGRVLPVGVVTAALGAPAIIVLLLRARREA